MLTTGGSGTSYCGIFKSSFLGMIHHGTGEMAGRAQASLSFPPAYGLELWHRDQMSRGCLLLEWRRRGSI